MSYTTNNTTNRERTFSCKVIMRDISNMTSLFWHKNSNGELVYGFNFDAILPCPEELMIVRDADTAYGLNLVSRLYREIEKTGLMTEEELSDWQKIVDTNFEAWRRGSRAYHNIEEYGVPTWFEWRQKNWGCVSNPDSWVRDGNDAIEFVVVGGTPIKVIKELSKKFGTYAELYCNDITDGNSADYLHCIFKNGNTVETEIVSREVLFNGSSRVSPYTITQRA